MKRIIQHFKNRKERQRLQEEARLRSEFSVVERGGYLWLTHDGVAFMKISSVAYAADAVKELLIARDTAVEFKKL